MNRFYVCLLAVLLMSAVAIRAHGDHGDHDHDHDHEEEVQPSKSVKHLTDDTFQATIIEHDIALVMFYAPWCGHCKSLKPLFGQAADNLAENSKIALAMVDCTLDANAALCKLNKVEYYPTLILFRNGVPEPYEVERSVQGITDALLSELLPPVTVLETAEALQKFSDDNSVAFVGFFDNDHDDRYAAFKTVVSGLKKFAKFGAVINQEFGRTRVPSGPGAILFSKADGESVETPFTGAFETEVLTTFVRVNLLPVLGEINGATYKKYDGVGLPLAYVFVNTKEKEVQESTLATMKQIATEQKGKVVFCWVDHGKYPQQAKYMGLTGEVIPGIALEVASKSAKYLMPEDTVFTHEAVSEWVNAFVAGTLTPFVKSEAVPESNDGPVKIIVGKTYNEIVNNAEHDVLVEYYAPWCGHCKTLAPIYEELGQHFANAPSVVIAKVDATANDVPAKLNIQGFPTILLFKAGDKDNHVTYEGHRDLDSLVNFMNTHTSFPLPEANAAEDVEEVVVNVAKQGGKAQIPHDEL
eukprot:gene12197-14274_t